MKFLYCILIPLLLANCVFAQSDTLQVYFNTDDPFLNKKALMKLDRAFLEVSGSNQVLIIGYADYRGDTYYNDMLSMRRAQSVAGYFERKGLDRKNISLVYGKGEIPRKTERADGYAADRRVDVILMDSSVTWQAVAVGKPGRMVTKNDSLPKEKTLDDIKTMKVGESLVLSNINFFLNSSRIMPQSQPTLEQLYRTMKDNPGLSIQIEGHICCTTTNEGVIGDMAQQLSLNRAEAIEEFLLNKGIAKTRMRHAGFGRTRPKVTVEKTEWDRLANRRVEIRILTK